MMRSWTQATKKQRLLRCVDAYRRMKNRSAVTTSEVASWMLGHGLYPPATRYDPPQAQKRWETRFIEATREFRP